MPMHSKSTPSNAGQANFEAMLLKGLEEVKNSVISLCETTIHNSSPDLTALCSHTMQLPDSLRLFSDDVLRRIKLRGHSRYASWYNKLVQGMKRPHEVKLTIVKGEGSKKSRQA